jgi:hypothetical protein
LNKIVFSGVVSPGKRVYEKIRFDAAGSEFPAGRNVSCGEFASTANGGEA